MSEEHVTAKMSVNLRFRRPWVLSVVRVMVSLIRCVSFGGLPISERTAERTSRWVMKLAGLEALYRGHWRRVA